MGPQRGELSRSTLAADARAWILASASPRRIEMLRAAGQRFDVEASGIEEARHQGERPLRFAARVAREKAEAVLRRRAGAWVLAADTIVVLGTSVLGKPADRREATSMLRRLSGREHEVATAFVLVDPRGRIFADRSVRSEVRFRELRESEIERYIDTGEPMDKAGAYAIQGGAGEFIVAVRGSRSNVVGLPLDEVRAALTAAKLWRPAPGEVSE